ncbi:hypothetical protein KY308_03405 [Candidatus Woesearchaeota archaeon]|nr:hypothetical protein [Candidatus Woesearchaeota archaeon]
MEKIQLSKKQALDRIKAADHMLTQTYPMIKDTRILLSVLTNLYQALEHGMAAVLHFDRANKKIPPFHDNFDSKLHIFRSVSAIQHNMLDFVPMIVKIKEIEDKHKSSPIEFTRKDSFVICDEDYRLKIISLEELKGFLNETKRFYFDIEKLTKEGILREQYA